jgi:hypothetical protein
MEGEQIFVANDTGRLKPLVERPVDRQFKNWIAQASPRRSWTASACSSSNRKAHEYPKELLRSVATEALLERGVCAVFTQEQEEIASRQWQWPVLSLIELNC